MPRGMVHRDIKPENVMICERGGEYDFVKLLDFGIVKRIEPVPDAYPDAHRALTRQLRLLGTPTYMPPERIGHPSDVDPRTDVYGVGALIYFLTAGHAPFVGGDEASILREVLAMPAPRLANVMPGVPPEMEDLVARCLAKTPMIARARSAISSRWRPLRLPPWTRDHARAWWEQWRASQVEGKSICVRDIDVS